MQTRKTATPPHCSFPSRDRRFPQQRKSFAPSTACGVDWFMARSLMPIATKLALKPRQNSGVLAGKWWKLELWMLVLAMPWRAENSNFWTVAKNPAHMSSRLPFSKVAEIVSCVTAVHTHTHTRARACARNHTHKHTHTRARVGMHTLSHIVVTHAYRHTRDIGWLPFQGYLASLFMVLITTLLYLFMSQRCLFQKYFGQKKLLCLKPKLLVSLKHNVFALHLFSRIHVSIPTESLTKYIQSRDQDYRKITYISQKAYVRFFKFWFGLE